MRAKNAAYLTLAARVGIVLVLLTSVNPVTTAKTPKDRAPEHEKSSDIPEIRTFPVNEKINPCENFYEYACSEVVDSFKLPDNRVSHTFAFSDSAERLLEKKKEFLRGLQSAKDLTGHSRSLQTVYNACMNVPARKKEESNLVRKTKQQLTAIKNRQQFLDFLGKQREDEFFTFVDVGTIPNQDNPDYDDFIFLADMMTLPERSYYHKKEVYDGFTNLLTQFFKTVDPKNARQRAEKVAKMERDFAETYPLPAEIREILVEKSSISKSEIKKKYSEFHLDEPLKQVPDQTNIRHLTPENYDFVARQLKTADLQVLKDLYLFHALSSILDDAYPEYQAKKFAFNRDFFGGPKERPDRQERCTKWVMDNFDKELDNELLPKIFPNFPEKQFIDLAVKVKSAIIAGIKENEWLSAQGKKGAIAKLKAARLQLVKPRNEEEWYFNPPAAYDPNTPIDNSRRLTLALKQRMYKELGKKRNKNRWGMGPLTVNAYYSPSENKFVMPVGILQYPFYDPNLPSTINLGAVGAVIGHELGHGIDDKGAMYDAKGRLVQWMTDEDLENFKKAGAKFIEQFDATGHNGRLTLGENIGDWTGLTFAYRAAFPEGKGKRELKQKFFLQYARLWCGVMRPKYREMRLKTDPHALGFARVNEQVKHQAGFAEAFQCKHGDPMTLPPEKHIKIW